MKVNDGRIRHEGNPAPTALLRAVIIDMIRRYSQTSNINEHHFELADGEKVRVIHNAAEDTLEIITMVKRTEALIVG